MIFARVAPQQLGTVRAMVAQFVDAVAGRLAAEVNPLVVAIDGRSGTGKSTLACEAAPHLDAAIVGVDTFFSGGDDGYWRTRTPRQRNAEVIDWQRLRAEAIEPLRAGLPARWRPFDYDTWKGLAAVPISVEPARVILVEGAYSAGPWLADTIDLAVLLTLDADVRLHRLRAREGPERTTRWLATWKPAEDLYFDQDCTPERFDLVLAAEGQGE